MGEIGLAVGEGDTVGCDGIGAMVITVGGGVVGVLNDAMDSSDAPFSLSVPPLLPPPLSLISRRLAFREYRLSNFQKCS